MLVTFVVIISAVLLSVVSSSSNKCQLGCNDLSYPPARCEMLFLDLLVQTIPRFSSILGTDDINCTRATLRAQLENFCSRECLSTFPTYQICVGGAAGEQIANFTLTGLCTRHADGTFCPLKILEEATGPGNAFAPPCANVLRGSCDSDCRTSYRSLSSRLGCCGSSWYDNPAFPSIFSYTPSGVRRQFATCNVALDGPCEVVSGATTMVYLSSVLVVAIACLLSLTSVV